ncbi:hypothetical protein [Paenibacillus sp. JDR-2]|uniref:hypothetical protein n=1 Tax=Paenibacillus sp. (strain JDR-2) TaxID=324057 RepID=UPI00016642BE|nr:hypothetical protein [Paenibacillus sp. JDR-2]ACT01490.1 hypothetical protein Pjdr2_2839 [Paenibacillus sp. JDR-2]
MKSTFNVYLDERTRSIGEDNLKQIIAVILLSMICITGCSFDNEAKGIKPILYKETVGNLAYEIMLNKNRYKMNDEIVVKTKITNQGKDTLTYVSGSSSCPNHAVVNVIHVKSNKRLEIKPYGPCTADLGKSKMKPGQTVEDTDIYIAEVYGKSGQELAPLGKYDIEAALPPEDIRSTENNHSVPIEQRQSVKTQIVLVR